MTLILITHKLKEVMRLCDFVTVMRAGRVVQELPIDQASVTGLAQAMVGHHVPLGRVESDAAARPGGEVLLKASQLEVRDELQQLLLSDVSLTLRAGEIVGVAGLSGNGQSELLDVLSGLLTPSQGRLTLNGRDFTPRSWLDPHTARQLGLAHVPEDRQARALVLGFAAWESAVLGHEALPVYGHGPWLQRAAMQQATAHMMARFDVRPRNVMQRSGTFSGGNQQKLVLARELGQNPRVLLVGQPTRGVDIGAMAFIHAQLRELRDAGCAVLLVSSELDEILTLADRVIVMNQGRISGELALADCTEAGLGLLMSGDAA